MTIKFQQLIRLLTALAIVLFSSASHAQDASVQATLSQASMVFGDSVALTISARNVDKAIDLTPLEKDFNITGRSSSRNVSIINGEETAVSSWVIQIEPKRPGVLTVPAVSVGNFQSQPLALNVGSTPTGQDRVLFIEASVDTDAPYVQSQVLMTVKVWQSVNLLDSSKTNLGSDQFVTVALERDQEYVATRDGKEFLVQEQQFALFPQSSGVHTFGPIELRAKIPVSNNGAQGFFTPTRSVKRLSNPITFNVQPRPDSTQGQWWLPASDVQIRESWSGDTTNIDANGTVTRTIEVIATGISADQLPEIELPNIEGLKLYSDNVNRSSKASDKGVVSTQTVTWAVVPERNGDIKVPALKLNWFDTNTGQTKVAALPEQTLTVQGALQEAAPVLASNPDEPSRIPESQADDSQALTASSVTHQDLVLSKPSWLWVLVGAIGLLIAQALCIGLWQLWKSLGRSERSTPRPMQDNQRVPSLAQVRAAVRQNDLAAVQQAVLNWASEFWPQSSPKNLFVVAQRLQEPQLERVFQQMDSALYGSASASVDLSSIEQQMNAGASRLVDAGQRVSQGSQLPAL